MSLSRVRIRSAGARAVLQSAAVRKALREAAQPVRRAAELRAADYDDAFVEVEDYTTDRAVVQVVLDHPKATQIEAKYGTLKASALASGLDVRGTR